MYMKSTTIFLILGILLLVYLIHRNVINTSTTTTKKSVTFVHHNSGLHPYYNPYKNQFYN